MNLYALTAGIVIALYVAMRFRKSSIERKDCVYPLLLATFPIYYWIFAIYSSDYVSLQKEVLIGILFIGLAFTAYKMNNRISLLLLATGYIGHAIYDVVHNLLFINMAMNKPQVLKKSAYARRRLSITD